MMRDEHPQKGRDVVVYPKYEIQNLVEGAVFTLEDWWENVSGTSWRLSAGNPAALQYAARSGMAGLPDDDEVVYGKIGHLGYLVHISELGEV